MMTRQTFTVLLALLMSTLAATAAPDFQQGAKYHIVCQQYAAGCVTDGASAQQSTPLYHLTQATTADETWWTLEEDGDGLFAIRNAKTGEYVTYDGVRQDISDGGQLRRYISLTAQRQGQASLWSFVRQSEGVYAIRNAQQTDHIWDVRTDSRCVGTYSNTGAANQNQQFAFVDTQGQRVTEPQSEPAPTSGFDVSTWLGATTDSGEGWTTEGYGWSDPGFGYYTNGQASVISPFLERWNSTTSGALTDGAIYQQLRLMPAGSYELSADIISVRQASTGGGWWQQQQQEEPGHGVYLFAGSQQAEAGTANERPQHYTVSFTLDSQQSNITVGLRISNTNANWVAFDNFRLSFVGTQQQLLDAERQKVRAELSDYYTTAEIDDMMAQAGDSFDALEALRLSVAHMPKADPLAAGARNITIDGHALTYVESGDYYLCSIPLSSFGKDLTATIAYDQREGYGQLRINGNDVASGATFTFKGIAAEKTYSLRINTTDQQKAVMKTVTFTSLPVVSIYGSFSNNYSDGMILVAEPDKGTPELLNMEAKWRGGITNGSDKHKRNYHVKLKDADHNKLERKFFGLRNDNSWILEACQVDMSRVRNRVLTDLWNDYSTPPYYIDRDDRAMTGTRGRFVELLLNGEYRGIYCMTENMDRKQMKLKKIDEETGTVHGQLWKSKDWSYAVFMGHDRDNNYYPGMSPANYNNASEMWDQYEVKYPDFEDYGYQTDWETLYQAVKFVCTASDQDFKKHFEEYFDLPLLIDYYILMETILSSDNHGKNMFFGVYDKQEDKKITFSVWDMDATCGQRWSDIYFHNTNIMSPERDYSEYITNEEHGDYNLFRRLRQTNTADFNERVRVRYRDLRDTWLATESILQRFRTYLDEFKTCGAAPREYARWSYDSDIAGHVLDFDDEMDYLTDWFTRRMNYLDTQRFDIGSLPPATVIAATSQRTSAPLPVYNLSGQQVGTSDRISQLPSGIYVVGGRKVIKE